MKKRLLAIVAGALVLLLAWGMSQSPETQGSAMLVCLVGVGLVAIGIRRKRSGRKEGIISSMLYGVARFNLMLSVLLMGYCFVLMVVLFLPWSLIAVLGLIAWFGKRRYKQLTSGGTAAWASKMQMWAGGLLGATSGQILGRCGEKGTFWERLKILLSGGVLAKQACEQFVGNGEIVRLPPTVVNTAVFGPVGSGKTTGLVLPFLFDCVEESCYILDFKGELTLLTAEHRERMGHKVIVLDPFGLVTQSAGKKRDKKKLNRTSDRLDPVDFIDKEDRYGLDMSHSIADAIVVEPPGSDGKSAHFYNKARKNLAGYLAVTAAYGDKVKGTRTIQVLPDLAGNVQKGLMAQELMKKCAFWEGMLARIGHEMSLPTNEELSSIRSVTANPLQFLSTPGVRDVTMNSTFDPAEMKTGKRPVDIYVVISLEFAEQCKGLLRMWTDLVMKRIIRQGLDESRKVHFVLDETATLGPMKAIDQMIQAGRGFGIRLQTYWQSMAQLKPSFPVDGGQTLLSNSTFMGPSGKTEPVLSV